MKRSVFFSVLGAAVATILLGGTLAGATAMNFILGGPNAPDAPSTVTAQNKDGLGGLNGQMIRLTNNSRGGSATALGLNVAAGRPPLTVNSTAKVTNLNADRVDGIDSTGLIRGQGKTYVHAVALTRLNFSHTYVPPPVAPGFFNVELRCPETGASPEFVHIHNLAGSPVNFFLRNDIFQDTEYGSLASGSDLGYAADSDGDLTTLTVNGLPGGAQTTATVTVATRLNVDTCYLQIQALVTQQ